MTNNIFKVIIPVYNAESWISTCINSVLNQSYKNFDITIINDRSTDKTLEKICNTFDISIEAILLTKLSFMFEGIRITIINNKERKLALYNIINGISYSSCNDEDIIVLLDGDDYLADESVFKYLAGVYSNDNIWLTHGHFQILSNGDKGCNSQVEDTRKYRHTTSWQTSHLRTFKYKIWKQIKDEDFRDNDGKYYSMAWDLAIMYPLVEMCGKTRIKFIDRVLYIYNDKNPINDSKVDYNLQMKYTHEIRLKKQYEEL
jgi:glycosyltransferase involved in cell wall biosynthesis